MLINPDSETGMCLSVYLSGCESVIKFYWQLTAKWAPIPLHFRNEVTNDLKIFTRLGIII